MIGTIKRAAMEAVQSGAPAGFMFGQVTAIAPVLKIRVEDRFDIEGDSIILMKEFRTGQSYPTHRHTLVAGGSTGSTSGGSGEDSFSSHSHTLGSGYMTNSGEGSEIYYGLLPGEKVVLFRNAGGQSFLVLGRL